MEQYLFCSTCRAQTVHYHGICSICRKKAEPQDVETTVLLYCGPCQKHTDHLVDDAGTVCLTCHPLKVAEFDRKFPVKPANRSMR